MATVPETADGQSADRSGSLQLPLLFSRLSCGRPPAAVPDGESPRPAEWDVKRMTDQRDPELYQRVRSALLEAHEAIMKLREAGQYMPTYGRFPMLSYFDTGFPSIHHQVLTRIPDYTSAFARQPGSIAGPILYSSLDSFNTLFEYSWRHERLRSMFLPPEAHEEDEVVRRMFEMMVAEVPLRILDRYLHTQEGPIREEVVLDIYSELETGIFEDTLPVDIVVPIVLTTFDTTEPVRLGDGVLVERLDDPSHRARVPSSYIGGTVNEVVLGAATHALVLTGWEIPNSNRWRQRHDNLAEYPIDVVDAFFDAMRIVTGIDTGYAQLVIRPLSWAWDYVADLPVLVHGPLVRRYPPTFDNYGWLTKRDPVSLEDLRRVGEAYGRLTGAPAEVRIASGRLSSSMLRSDEADIILDLCIGLEALLGEKGGEVTHKLALRVAAVTGLSELVEFSPQQIFTAVKRIYRYRSEVVHGDHASSGVINGIGSSPIPAERLATLLLRAALNVILWHMELLNPATVDRDLILGALADIRPSTEEKD
jgi:hypothetical protein